MSTTSSGLSFARLFSDHAVLQREVPLKVWGKARPGARVGVNLAGQKVEAVADERGRWKVEFSPVSAGGPFELVARSGDEVVRARNVLVGEVWVCAGQSNMEMSLGACGEGVREDIASADFPEIREMRVGRNAAGSLAEDVTGNWQMATPETAKWFSGTAFYFARRVHADVKVPIGLIVSAWGGTMAESWVSRSAIEKAGTVEAMRILNRKPGDVAMPHVDPGNKGEALGYADAGFDDSEWKTMDLPRFWESTGLVIDGAVWFRREVEVPPEWLGRDLTLSLGPLDDFDVTYFNGVRVGGIGEDNPNAASTPRVYTVPAKLVRTGRNVIATRVFDQWGGGGFGGKAEQLFVKCGDETRSMQGLWKFFVELELPQRTPEDSVGPTSLFNGMIHPLLGYGIRGATWYQGESNAGRPHEYQKLLEALIRQWREDWGQGEFPFLIVQLPNYKKRDEVPGVSSWAEIREAQAGTAEALSNVDYAVTIDVGDPDDIHPANKRDVGERLGRLALVRVYGKVVSERGPVFTHSKVEGAKVRVHFSHATSGLVARGGKVSGFAIAGADRKFVWADAEIDGGTVVVSARGVEKPVAVRYGWADNPECTLFNGAGLPAAPFRTDTWPRS